jgi:hypothetical protein
LRVELVWANGRLSTTTTEVSVEGFMAIGTNVSLGTEVSIGLGVSAAEVLTCRGRVVGPTKQPSRIAVLFNDLAPTAQERLLVIVFDTVLSNAPL